MGYRTHCDFGFTKFVRMALTLIENTLGNISPKVSDAQGDHQYVVHLPDDRNKVGDELNRTDDIKDRAAGDYFRMPWHQRVHQSPPHDSELFENPLE